MDDRTYDDLVLALMYAMSWTEKFPEGYRRSWIGFDFDSLDRLEERGMVSGRHGNKSKWITPEGIARAERIIEILKGVEPELAAIPFPEKSEATGDEEN